MYSLFSFLICFQYSDQSQSGMYQGNQIPVGQIFTWIIPNVYFRLVRGINLTLKMEIEFRFGLVNLRDSGKTRTSSSDVGCGLNGKIKLRLKEVSEWR